MFQKKLFDKFKTNNFLFDETPFRKSFKIVFSELVDFVTKFDKHFLIVEPRNLPNKRELSSGWGSSSAYGGIPIWYYRAGTPVVKVGSAETLNKLLHSL